MVEDSAKQPAIQGSQNSDTPTSPESSPPSQLTIHDRPGARHVGLMLARQSVARAAVQRHEPEKVPLYLQSAFTSIFMAAKATVAAGREPSYEEIQRTLSYWVDNATPDGAQRENDAAALAIIEHIPTEESLQIDEAEAQRRSEECEREMLARAGDNASAQFEFTTDEALDKCLGSIEWLWEGYIPKGFPTLVTGEQDLGKSSVVQGLCHTILSGHQWPDGQAWTAMPNAKLLWIDTEGSIALFHQRAKAWGMPRGCFILPKDPLQELTIDNATNWAWIEAAVERFQPPLVVIDALSGAHNGKENASDDMKKIMKKLGMLAQRFGIAVVVIHHLSKPAPGVPSFPITIHRLRGSTSITQYCRAILALGTPDPARPESRRLDVIKLNLARKPDPVGYELTDDGPIWGEAVEVPRQRRALDDAKDFLSVALRNGTRPSSEVTEEAKAQGIGMNAINDAKKALGVKALREGGQAGRWFWKLSEVSE